MAESRGSIAFFTTYRPPVPLDIFSCPVNPQPSSCPFNPAAPPSCPVNPQPSSSVHGEVLLTDGESYNQNCRPIPAAALSELLTFLGKKSPELASRCGATPGDAAAGRVTGLVFVSERDDGLETLHVALRFNGAPGKAPVVLRLADIYGADNFGGARIEDSGCVAGGFDGDDGRPVGHCLVYVSTKEPAAARRTPWTVVYKTNLADGRTERLTPPDQYDLSPAVSPSGKTVAAANFKFHRWTGELQHLKTDIVVMNVDRQAQGGLRRKVLIRDGGWPSWGSDGVVFFHRGVDKRLASGDTETTWGVFRYDVATGKTVRVTPEGFDAVTPAAISETRVAVATIRQKPGNSGGARVEAQYRRIEIFDVAAPNEPARITNKILPLEDFYNPFILDGGARVGYHRCRRTGPLQQDGSNSIKKNFDKLQSPKSHEDVGLFRVSGVFPTISKDVSKLAFVDNSFKSVWLADGQSLHKVHERREANSIFSIVWNQNPEKDTLYVCIGPSFQAAKPLDIFGISNVSSAKHTQQEVYRLTKGKLNNAFPSSNPVGTKFVFRSTRDGGEKNHKNLYIMEDADIGEFGEGTVTRLTNGPWTDTHCSWSPRGDWIVFSSCRDKPDGAPEKDILDPGFFAIYLVNANNPDVVVRVMKSSETIAGHVTHPMFSPDMRSIVVTADLAAVSAETISMPQFLHSVRPYGDVFSFNLRDMDEITKNEDIEEFHRITHSRYEYATPTWTKFATDDPNSHWNKLVTKSSTGFGAACPR